MPLRRALTVSPIWIWKQSVGCSAYKSARSQVVPRLCSFIGRPFRCNSLSVVFGCHYVDAKVDAGWKS